MKIIEELVIDSSNSETQHHDFITELFNDGLVPTVVMHDAAVPDNIRM
jgi:hypothetical protein